MGFIDVYLLEKSHVTYQQCVVDGLQEICQLSGDPYDYFFCLQGKVKFDSIDDAVELDFNDISFDTVGFTKEENDNAFKLTACILHLGEMTFKQRVVKNLVIWPKYW